MFYELLGRATFVLIVAAIIVFLISILLGIILVKKKKILLPRLLLFTVENFYHQYKKIARLFGIGENIIDHIGIELRNKLSLEAFATVKPEERILVLPQCVRHPKCPARLDSSQGIMCKDCGLCIIKDVKAEANRLGYKFYAVPGGRFVERIVKRVKPKAALGVACYKDLNSAMQGLSKSRFVVQGVPLVKDGCVATEVNLNELFRRMRLGIEDKLPAKSPCEEAGTNKPLS